MPYFQIKIWLKSRTKPFYGIRFFDIYNVDEVYRLVNKRANEKFKHEDIKKIDCFMLPSESEEVKNLIAKENKEEVQKEKSRLNRNFTGKNYPQGRYHTGE